MSSLRAPADPAGAPGPPASVAPWIRRAMLANVIAQIGIVVTGGLVRVTGSGLGCPTWPQCVPGSYLPVAHQAESYHKYIEFGNRTLTSVVGATALVALLAALMHLRRTGAPRSLAIWGAAPLALVAVQAVLGGISVLLGLTPVSVAAHFLVSMVLIAVSTVLLGRIGPPGPTITRPELRLLTVAIAVTGAVVLVLGTVVTGSGPHSGDAETPARFGFDPGTVSWLHADAVWLLIGLVIALAVGLRLVDADPRLRRRVGHLIGAIVLQAAIGYLQYATDLPPLLVVAHMAGAALLVVTLTRLTAAVRPTPTVRPTPV